jgi:hypothetical protein
MGGMDGLPRWHISVWNFLIITHNRTQGSYLSVRLSLCLPACLPVRPSVHPSIYSPFLDLGSFFSFLILYPVGRTPWTGDQPVTRPLPTHKTTQTQNKHTQTFMPWVGFEPTITGLEGVKTVHALDRAATVIGTQDSAHKIIIMIRSFIELKQLHMQKKPTLSLFFV